MENIWHVVLISFKPGTSEKTRQNIYSRLQTLAEDCGGKSAGILFWKVEFNLFPQRNVHLVEIAVFENNDVLQAFRLHPRHKESSGTTR